MLVEFIVPNEITNPKLKLGNEDIELVSGETYIINHLFMKDSNSKPVTIEELNLEIHKELNDKTILFSRTFGFGDILFLSGLIQYLKDNYNCKIGFATAKKYSPILNILNIDYIETLPLKKKDFNKYDYYFEVTGLIEDTVTNENIYDVYFKKLGVPDIDNKYKKPFVNYPKNSFIRNTEDRIIGIHPFAANSIRSYQPYLVNQLVLKLLDKNYQIVIFGNEYDKLSYQNIISKNVLWSCDSDWLKTAKLMGELEWFIGVDSALIHFVQTIPEVKSIALYGPFSGESRVKYYNNIITLDSNPDCRCNVHKQNKCPKNFTYSPCMNFDPDQIINIIENKEFPEFKFQEIKISKYGI